MLDKLPAPIRIALQQAIADGIEQVFLCGAAIVVPAVIAGQINRQVPLRGATPGGLVEASPEPDVRHVTDAGRHRKTTEPPTRQVRILALSVNSEDARTAASVAMGFDRMARFYDTPWFQRVLYRLPQDAVLSGLRGRGSRRILDVGCGTGVFADRIHRELSPDDVVGVDPSTGMLAQAKARSSAVRWRVGTAEALPLPDESVDAVTSTTAFHFFDQPAAMAEFYRVLAPGGILALATIAYGLPTPILLPSIVQKWRPLPHNPSAAELRDLFGDAGFELVEQCKVHSYATRLMWYHRITVGRKPSRPTVSDLE